MFYFLVQGPFGSMIPAMNQEYEKFVIVLLKKSAYFCNKKAFGYYGINIFLYFWIDITSLLGVPF